MRTASALKVQFSFAEQHSYTVVMCMHCRCSGSVAQDSDAGHENTKPCNSPFSSMLWFGSTCKLTCCESLMAFSAASCSASVISRPACCASILNTSSVVYSFWHANIEKKTQTQMTSTVTSNTDLVLPSPLNQWHIGLLVAFYILSVLMLILVCHFSLANSKQKKKYIHYVGHNVI